MTLTFDIIINRRGGTVLRDGEAAVEKSLRAAFGKAAGYLRFVEGHEVAGAVQDWLADPKNEKRDLVIGGGDGTLLTAARQVLNKDVTLGVLPLGTQNFIARDLGFSPDYRKAAEQLTKSVARTMDVGCVNGHYFLFWFLIDKAAELQDAREAARAGDMGVVLQKVFNFASRILGGKPQKLALTDDKGAVTDVEGRFFAVTSSALTPRSSRGQGLWIPTAKNLLNVFGNAFARPEKGDGQLAFYAHKGGGEPVSRLYSRLYDGNWDKDPKLAIYKSTAFTIAPAGAGAGGKVAINLDGETRETDYPLSVTIHPQALKLRCNPG